MERLQMPICCFSGKAGLDPNQAGFKVGLLMFHVMALPEHRIRAILGTPRGWICTRTRQNSTQPAIQKDEFFQNV